MKTILSYKCPVLQGNKSIEVINYFYLYIDELYSWAVLGGDGTCY